MTTTIASGPSVLASRTAATRRSSRRTADEQALLARDAARHQERIAIRDAHHLVDHAQVDGLGQVAHADAFDGVRARNIAGIDRAFGIGADDVDRRILLFEKASRARDRSAGSDACDEMRDRSAGLLPNLGTGRMVVRVGIEMIVKLIGLKCARDLRREAVGDAVIRFRRIGRNVGRRDYDVGAIGAQQVDLFSRHLVGHHQDAAIAANRGGHCQAGTGIAARRLDDRAARFEQTLALGGIQHCDRGAILDAAAGINVLDLGEHQARRAVDDFVQPYQRRVADRV